MIRFVLISALVITLSGCVQRMGDFTVISTRNYDPSAKYELSERRVTGEDMRSIIVVIPTGIPNMEDAIEDALNKGGGDYMTDAALHNRSWYIPYIYGRMGFRITGDVWRKIEGQ
jgi:hypothetical protein